MDNFTLPSTSECTKEQSAVEAIRNSSRKSLFLNRRRLKDEETDGRRYMGNCSSETYITEIVDKLKTKSSISVEELNTLKNALLDDVKTTEVVLNTHGALRGIVRDLSGHNATKQCAAAGCLCNLGLGDSKAGSVVAKAAGSYLVAFLDNMSDELAEKNHEHGEDIKKTELPKKPTEITTHINDKTLKYKSDVKIDKMDNEMLLREIKSDHVIKKSLFDLNVVPATHGSSNVDNNFENLSKNGNDADILLGNNIKFTNKKVINVIKVENEDHIVVLIKHDDLISKNDNGSSNNNDIEISEINENNDSPVTVDTSNVKDEVIDAKTSKSKDTFILKKSDSDIQILQDIDDILDLLNEEPERISSQTESKKGDDEENYMPIENDLEISELDDSNDITTDQEIQYKAIAVKVKINRGIQIETPEDPKLPNETISIHKLTEDNTTSIESNTDILKNVPKYIENVESTDSEDSDNFEMNVIKTDNRNKDANETDDETADTKSETDDENLEMKSDKISSSNEHTNAETDCSDETDSESDHSELLYATKQMIEVVIALTNLINKKCSNNEDECDIFGKLIAMRLRKLPYSQRLELMREIDALLLQRSSREVMASCRMSPISEPEY